MKKNEARPVPLLIPLLLITAIALVFSPILQRGWVYFLGLGADGNPSHCEACGSNAILLRNDGYRCHHCGHAVRR